MTRMTVTPTTPETRVLVVDDELHVRTALACSLTLLGYRTDTAGSGYQALKMLKLVPYDVMVLDIRMPGMDGIEVMRRTCQMCPDLLIIVLTGHATLESAIAAVKSGAVDYLLKPAGIHDIDAAITRALQQRAETLHGQCSPRAMDPALDETRQEATAEPPPTLTAECFLRAGPVTLYQDRCLAVVAQTGGTGDSNAKLTASETALLAHLIQHPDTVLSCHELARSALGYEVSKREAQNIVRPHISRLRKKIEPDPAHPLLIRTIVGKGYFFAP